MAMKPSALSPDQSWLQFIFKAFHIQTPVLLRELAQSSSDRTVQLSLKGSLKPVK